MGKQGGKYKKKQPGADSISGSTAVDEISAPTHTVQPIWSFKKEHEKLMVGEV